MQLPTRIVDISMHLENEIVTDPEMMLPKIHYEYGEQNAEKMAEFFEGVTPDQLPGAEGWTWERI